jgi:hypothetical protein
MAKSTKAAGVVVTNLTTEEKIAFCEAWSKSNLSRSEFIRRNNLPSTFHYWCNTLLGDSKKAAPGIAAKSAVNATATANKIAAYNNKQNWISVSPSNHSLSTQAKTDTIHDLTELQLMLGDIKLNLHLPMHHLVNFIEELRYAATVIR